MAPVPREDCAKAVLHRASPREAVRSQREDAGRGSGSGSVLEPCLHPAQAEAGIERARSLLGSGWALGSE